MLALQYIVLTFSMHFIRFYKLFDDVEVPAWVTCRALCWQTGVSKSLKIQAFTRFFMFSCLAVLMFVRDTHF